MRDPEIIRNLKCFGLFMIGLLFGMGVLSWIDLLFGGK
jgi:hypothetical protein